MPWVAISHMVTPNAHCKTKQGWHQTHFKMEYKLNFYLCLCHCFSSMSTHHITLYGKNSVSQTLDCNPFYRHFGNPALPVIISTVDLFRQAKVCNTDCHIITEPVKINTELEWARQTTLHFKVSANYLYKTYMQLRAARSRCRKWRPLRYSIPKAMSIMNFRSVWVGRN